MFFSNSSENQTLGYEKSVSLVRFILEGLEHFLVIWVWSTVTLHSVKALKTFFFSFCFFFKMAIVYIQWKWKTHSLIKKYFLKPCRRRESRTVVCKGTLQCKAYSIWFCGRNNHNLQLDWNSQGTKLVQNSANFWHFVSSENNSSHDSNISMHRLKFATFPLLQSVIWKKIPSSQFLFSQMLGAHTCFHDSAFSNLKMHVKMVTGFNGFN